MSKYEIRQQTIYTGETKLVIVNTEIGMYAYFCGYDFMGSAEWKSDLMEAYYMDREEAEQIVKDLETAEETDEPEADPADQQMKSLQQSLDTCRSRRNDAWDSYDKLRIMENPNEGLINSAYRHYEKEQSFYEGFLMAVFAAGYTITTEVGTDKCTIVKEAK